MKKPVELPNKVAIFTFDQWRKTKPLVHCLTNEVVQSFTANILLALGASPAMVVDEDEAKQFAILANALLINIGTLYPTRAQTMLAAIRAAIDNGTPWVLDPVAVGVLDYRTRFAHELLALKPTAIRGNASEIIALAGLNACGRGVDSVNDSLGALPAARVLAKQTEAIVAITGAVDYVTDGACDYAISGGHALMQRVVGTGCGLSAVVAAFCTSKASRIEQLVAVATACRIMSCAGTLAMKVSSGPGSFVPAFLDALHHIRPNNLISGCKANT